MRSLECCTSEREARLAAAAVDLLGQRGALERERHLGRQRAQRGLARRRRSTTSSRGSPRESSARLAPLAAGRARRERGRQLVAARRGASVERVGVGRGGAPTSSSSRRARRARGRRDGDSGARRRAGERAARRRARPGRSPRGRRGRRAPRRRARACARARGSLLLAHEAGHADDDEAEQHDRGGDDDGHVDVAALQLVDELDRPARPATRTVSSARRSG